MEDSAQPTPSTHNNLPLQDAVALTKRALLERRHISSNTALRQSQLRPLLVTLDDRAARKNGDAYSAGLISSIVRDGIDKGWLSTDVVVGKAGSERIWLNRGPATTTSLRESSSRSDQAPPPSPRLDPDMTVASTKPAEIDKGRVRTLEMISSLKVAGLYSPKEIRDLILLSAAEILSQERLFPLSVSQLLREAKKSAENKASECGVSFDYWHVAADSVLELMLQSRVLLGPDDTPITVP